MEMEMKNEKKKPLTKRVDREFERLLDRCHEKESTEKRADRSCLKDRRRTSKESPADCVPTTKANFAAHTSFGAPRPFPFPKDFQMSPPSLQSIQDSSSCKLGSTFVEIK